MTNPYFTNPANLLPNQRAKAVDVSGDFDLVQAGFDGVNVNLVTEIATRLANDNTEIATRLANDNTEIGLRTSADLLLAPLAGASFTGPVTVQPPSASTNPATKAYVDATATSSGMVPIWISGTFYDSGKMVYSPTDYKTYRRVTSGVGTIDPILDGNWVSIASALPGFSYDNRNAIRSASSGFADIESLGLFYWVSGSTEPDDDETAFATATGVWELVAADPDYVYASWLANFDVLQSAVDDASTVLSALAITVAGDIAKKLYGSFAMSLTSLASATSTSFTATIVGAAIGDRIIVTPGNSFGTSTSDQSYLSYVAYVSAVNTVTISIRNASAASANMTASTWSVLVIKQ